MKYFIQVISLSHLGYRTIYYTSVLRYLEINFQNILVHNDSSEDHWWRGCKPRHGDLLTCTEHTRQFHDHDIIFDDCVCDTDLCNKNMGPLVSTTPSNFSSFTYDKIRCVCVFDITLKIILACIFVFVLQNLKHWTVTIVLDTLVHITMIATRTFLATWLPVRLKILDFRILEMFVM